MTEFVEVLEQPTELPVEGIPSLEVDNKGKDDKETSSQTDRIVDFAVVRYDLLHDRNRDVFAKSKHTGEIYRLRGQQFRDALTAAYYSQFEQAVRDQAMREAMNTLQALGRDGEPKEVFVRVGLHDGRYYVDLAQRGNSRAVEVWPGGWQIVERPPVAFVRSESMQALPDPVPGGDFGKLWNVANIPEEVQILVVAWLVDSLRPNTPYPGCELVGEQGSGKSTAAEAIRRVIDPNACNLRGAPRTVDDVFVSAGQNHVIGFENVSFLHGTMQDALAILSTGGGYSKRQLYSDAEEIVISVRRPWMVNGITACVTQQDLVDRVLSIECPVIEERHASSGQWESFDRDLPGILGGLYDIAANALDYLPEMKLPASERPRLLEYALLGMAVAKAMGKEPADFMKVFKASRAETIARTLDASPVATAVVDFVDANHFGLTASVKEIMSRLEDYKPSGTDAWPRTAKAFGDALRRAAPALRQVDIDCRCLGKSGGTVKWQIKHAAKQNAPARVQQPAEQGDQPTDYLAASRGY